MFVTIRYAFGKEKQALLLQTLRCGSKHVPHIGFPTFFFVCLGPASIYIHVFTKYLPYICSTIIHLLNAIYGPYKLREKWELAHHHLLKPTESRTITLTVSIIIIIITIIIIIMIIY